MINKVLFTTNRPLLLGAVFASGLAVPDQQMLTVTLDQVGVNRGGEARIIKAD